MIIKKLVYTPDAFKIYLSERELRALFWSLDYFSVHSCPDMAIVTASMASKIINSKLLNINIVNYAITD